MPSGHELRQRGRIGGIEFEPELSLLVRRVSRFMGMDTSDFMRLACYEKLYRHMKEGLLQHRLLAQPITEEEKALVIKWYEDGKLR